MMSLYRVLTIEYVRRIRFYWYVAVILFIGGPLAILGLLWLHGQNLYAGTFEPFTFNATHQLVTVLLFPLLTLVVQWQIYPHLYARPISTRAMAAWLMITGVVTVAGTNLLILLAYRFMLGANWPLLGPSLFFITVTLLAQCINWNLLKPTYFKLIAAFVVIPGAVIWFASRYHPEGFHKPMQPWFSPSVEELGTMLAASVVAVFWGLRGLSLARHESGGFSGANEPEDIADNYVSRRVPRLATVPQALNWFFWQRGMAYSLGASGTILLFMGILYYFTTEKLHVEEVLGTFTGLSFVVPAIICTIVGVALGLDLRHRVQFVLMPFLSTRPVTTSQLSRSLLWNAFKCTLLTWGILVVGIAAYCTEFFREEFFRDLHPDRYLGHRIHNSEFGMAAIPLTLAGSFLAAWTGLSWMAVLGWSGREKVMIWGIGLIAGGPVLYLLFVQFILPSDWAKFLTAAGVWLPAIVIPILTIDWTIAAWRGELISRRTVHLLAVLAIFFVTFFDVLLPGPPAGKTLAALYSLASLLPIPATPLMLAWNRHR